MKSFATIFGLYVAPCIKGITTAGAATKTFFRIIRWKHIGVTNRFWHYLLLVWKAGYHAAFKHQCWTYNL